MNWVPGDGNAGEDAHDGGEDQHQPHHHAGKVHGEHAVQDDEDVVVGQPEHKNSYPVAFSLKFLQLCTYCNFGSGHDR